MVVGCMEYHEPTCINVAWWLIVWYVMNLAQCMLDDGFPPPYILYVMSLINLHACWMMVDCMEYH